MNSFCKLFALIWGLVRSKTQKFQKEIYPPTPQEVIFSPTRTMHPNLGDFWDGFQKHHCSIKILKMFVDCLFFFYKQLRYIDVVIWKRLYLPKLPACFLLKKFYKIHDFVRSVENKCSQNCLFWESSKRKKTIIFSESNICFFIFPFLYERIFSCLFSEAMVDIIEEYGKWNSWSWKKIY
jgi:hypothetical protein